MTPDRNDALKNGIREWWASHPMTYGAVHGETEYEIGDGKRVAVSLGTREFFEMADQVFYGWNEGLHTPSGKFARIFDYPSYRGKKVLEVGCGMGCMAMNWAQQEAFVTAVDLNPVAVAQTRRRFEMLGLKGDIREMDAEHLALPNQSFEYVYSWGVLHHSPQLQHSMDEIFRVLRPGGKVGVMLYHRHSLLYLYSVWFLQGIVHMERRFLNDVELASRYGDGDREEGNPHTWPVTIKEAHNLFRCFQNVKVQVLGSEMAFVLDLICPHLGSRIIPRPCLHALGRRFGWSLWITAER